MVTPVMYLHGDIHHWTMELYNKKHTLLIGSSRIDINFVYACIDYVVRHHVTPPHTEGSWDTSTHEGHVAPPHMEGP